MPKKRKKKLIRHINQQGAYIHKELSHKKGLYFNMDIKRNHSAMRNLTGNAYKMYVYLCENADNKFMLLSGSQFCADSGVSPRAYVLAKQELIKNRYLVLREDGDYDFYNYQYRHHHETVFEKLEKLKEDNAINNNNNNNN